MESYSRLVDFSPTFYCLPKPLFLYGSMVLLSYIITTLLTMCFIFLSLVIMYWTLNSIDMQFEYQYPKSSNVSVEHVRLLREMIRSFAARGMYCLKLV